MTEQNTVPEGKRVMPRSDLDFNLMLTDTAWSNMHPELKALLVENYLEVNPETGEMTTKSLNLSPLLAIYQRDLRLANLSVWNGELDEVRRLLRLSKDFLQEGFIKPFLNCISDVAGYLETSQSKGGFLRRRQNTFTTEHYSQEEGPTKKSLFGKTPKKE